MSVEPFFAQLQTGKLPSVEDSMRYEALRLATYHKRPRGKNISASKLANAGFYYEGGKDIVACFKCGLRVDDWRSLGVGVDPLAVHMQRSPECAFLSNGEKENIPYTVRESELTGEAKKLLQRMLQRRSGLGDNSNSQKAASRHDSAHAPDPFQGALSSNCTNSSSYSTAGATSSGQMGSFCRSASSASTSQSRGDNSRSLFGSGLYTSSTLAPTPSRPLLDFHLPDVDSSRDDPAPNFKDEQVRLDTFTFWPNGAAARPSELAGAGFYYLGTEDRVQCAFCKGVLRNWEPTDRALVEHKKHFPVCPFIRNAKESGNIPVVNKLNGVILRKDNISDKKLDKKTLGIIEEGAYHPELATLVERINTYVNFFSDSRRSHEEFADAGFYFTGQGDNVKCFFCDGGLRNWERNDDPWLEHARWFPKCGYLLIKKGEEYVKDIRKRYSPPGTKKPRVRKMKQRYKAKVEAVEEAMRSEMVQDVIEMGFNLSRIKEVVIRRLEELGSSFPNVESLVDSLYETEELEQQGSDSDSDSEICDDFLGHSHFLDSKELKADGSGEGNRNQSEPVNEKTQKKKSKKKKKTSKAKNGTAHINPIELMSDEKGPQLAAEVQKMKDERLCKVCMDSEVNIVFLKCGHLVCCSDCAPALRHCPICRESIRGTIRVFLS